MLVLQVILIVSCLLLGTYLLLQGGAIFWKSKLQKCTTLFTTEAEYIAANEAGKVMIWLKKIFRELDLKQGEYVVYYDS